MDDLIALDVMKEARETLDWDVSDQKAVYACMRVLLKGFMTEMIEELEENFDDLPELRTPRDKH